MAVYCNNYCDYIITTDYHKAEFSLPHNFLAWNNAKLESSPSPTPSLTCQNDGDVVVS